MNIFQSIQPWLAASLLAALTACGGGGGRDPILGFAGTPLAPTVTAVSPASGAINVPLNNRLVTAAFSEPVAAIAGSASFTVTCASPCVNPTGVVSLDASGSVATFTMPVGNTLAPNTQYTATVTGATSVATGLTLVTPFVWRFTTGAVGDSTRPSVTITVPATSAPGPTPGVATNTAISAVFSEDMAPATITASSFTLTCASPCVNPAGSVSYSVGNRSAIFTPAAPLAANTTYTATVTTVATDLAGNALGGNQGVLPAASNYVWTFTTGAVAAPTGNVTVQSTNPANGAAAVCPDATINATFTTPSGLRMSPITINSANFTVTGAAPVTASSVVLDNATGRIASFKPAAPLVVGTTYTAKIRGGPNGVADVAVPANTMLADFTWTFTVAACAAPSVPPAVPLGAAGAFGTFGGSAGMTNQGLLTIINGNIGTTAVSTAVTGFHDAGPGCTYTETPLNAGTVNGLIYTAPPPPTVACPSEGTATTFAAALQARADALAAYNALVAMPPGANPGANLAGKTLAPGVYTSAPGSFMIQGGNLTLDAQGNANAVWVFQMATTLTVGGPGAAAPSSVILSNGAQAKNVFWQVGSAATINAAGGGTFNGTVISQQGADISTSGNVNIVTINGRVLSLNASVTMVNTVINVPAP